MDSKVEHIIKNYQYFELDETQKKFIADWAENSDEFEALQNTLLATDQFVASQKEGLNPVVKQRLDVRFAQKHDQKRLVWYNKLWFFLWPNESPFYKRPLIQFAAICLVVAITIPFFPDFSQPQLAVNEVDTEEKAQSEEETNTTHKKESLPEEVDKKTSVEEKEIAEEESDLQDYKSRETKVKEESVSTTNQEGWVLNEKPRNMAGVESRSERSQSTLKDVPSVTEDQEEVNFYDKSDIDAPALNQVGTNRLAENAEVPKKVDTKETLGLLTALY